MSKVQAPVTKEASSTNDPVPAIPSCRPKIIETSRRTYGKPMKKVEEQTYFRSAGPRFHKDFDQQKLI